jgi:hypothetical protein
MATSSIEQTRIQRMIRAASEQERSAIKATAEATLAQINLLMNTKVLSAEERKAADVAIETLVRLECEERGGGWWFRTKRRFQLLQMYLGS